MTRVAVGDARKALADTLNRVAYGRDRIVLHRRGKDVAALVSLEDLELLERLEDRLDLRAARKALADAVRKAERPIPLDEVKSKLGL